MLVFDSGVGGLTVLWECLKRMPNEIFYYYGDNHHAPYGNLPQEKIVELVKAAKTVCKDVEFSALDATRADVDFLVSAVKAAEETLSPFLFPFSLFGVGNYARHRE